MDERDPTEGKVITLRQPSTKDRKSSAPSAAVTARPVLTAKQEQFAMLVGFEGCTQAEAYRRAYDADDMLPKTIWSEASRLAGDPDVAARINEHKARKTGAVYRDADLARRMIFDRLLAIAETAPKDSDKLKALEMLGKLSNVKAFEDRVAIVDDTKDLSAAELEARLHKALSKLAG